MFTNSSYVANIGIVNPPDIGFEISTPRRSQLQNIVPMQIVDLVQHCEEEGPLNAFGVNVGMIRIVGQVGIYFSSQRISTSQFVLKPA